jgi:hypothetical protein
MTDKQITTIGRCYGCKRTFGFDAQSVTTYLIDPDTGLPPGMTVFGTARDPAPESVARSVREPVCPACVEKAKQTGDPSAAWGSRPPPDR